MKELLVLSNHRHLCSFLLLFNHSELMYNRKEISVDMSNRSSLFCRYNSKSSVKATQQKRFQSLPHKLYHKTFFKTCVDEILSLAVFRGTDRSSKTLEFKSPEAMEITLYLKFDERNFGRECEN